MPRSPLGHTNPPYEELDEGEVASAHQISADAASPLDDEPRMTFLVVKNRYERGQVHNYLTEVAERL